MKILVIEDNPVSRESLRAALEAEGHHILEAADGKTGLELMVREKPDLVVEDLLLPDMDGFALASQLRALAGAAEVPILALTGLLTKADELKMAEAQFTDYLFKPVQSARLVATVLAQVGAVRSRVETPDTERQERMAVQLNRQARLSAQLARRCAVQSAQISVLTSLGENLQQGNTDTKSLLNDVLAHYLDVTGLSRGAIYSIFAPSWAFRRERRILFQTFSVTKSCSMTPCSKASLFLSHLLHQIISKSRYC